jgi:hypothetical protein
VPVGDVEHERGNALKNMGRLSVLALAMTSIASGTLVGLAPGIASAASTDAPSNLPVITLAMDGKSVTVGGTLVSGAVDIRSTVTGEGNGSPTLFRLNPGDTVQQVFAAVGSSNDPNATQPYGSLVFSGNAPKGTSDLQTTLTPGNYAALDFGSMNGNSSGPPPYATFTIAQATSEASLPTPGATVTAIDFRFQGPKSLKNGEIVRTTNHGYVVHMVDAIGVKSVSQANKLMALLRAGKDNQAQKLANNQFIALAGTVSPGAVVQQTVHAKAGVYVLACFMDTQDGREHTQLGMLRMIKIV